MISLIFFNAIGLALAEKYQYQGVKKKQNFQHKFYLFAKNGFLRNFKAVLNDITYALTAKELALAEKYQYQGLKKN